MVLDYITEWLSEYGHLPNKLTTRMGRLIRQAREEMGMSQAELARKVYRRQASLSKIEAGTMRVDAETLMYLAFALNKTIYYFFPEELVPGLLEEGKLPSSLTELLMQARKLSTDDLEKLTTIARSLFDLANRKSEKETEERVEWILEKYPDLTLDEAILIERDSYVATSRIHDIIEQIEEKEIEKVVQQRNKTTKTTT